ncbi:dihydroorotate dehydrogenase-like protein [candidate division KSB1 bacterium]|nr:dihydroorotate dehydrogenase-like protein [candidate division KSB1 bacterium]
MPSLRTRYLNLPLKNPIVVASSGLSKSAESIRACADAGAGAVVVKSLFEEAIAQEDWGMESSLSYHTEVYDYLRSEMQHQYGPRDYCRLIETAKKNVDIPVIASINCISAQWWPSYAAQIESAGADALELNVYPSVVDTDMRSQEVEHTYFEIIEAVREKVRIPVAMKIAPYFASLPFVAYELCRRGADALVLFNRFTQPDIDIDAIKLTTTFQFSTSAESHLVLRWIALLAGKISGELAATTGVHTSRDLIKMLLAGAQVVQVASAFYQNGVKIIPTWLEELKHWMHEHAFETIEQFRGTLSFAETRTPEHYLRSQFVQKIRGVE